jgi:hypothetical protein
MAGRQEPGNATLQDILGTVTLMNGTKVTRQFPGQPQMEYTYMNNTWLPRNRLPNSARPSWLRSLACI